MNPLFLQNLKKPATGTTVGASNAVDVAIQGTVLTSNTSVGATGAAVPANATHIGGKDAGGLLQPVTVTAASALKTDSSATTQPVSAAALPLPTGAATEATLSTLNGKVTAVNTGAVVVSSSALPAGAATETTLSSLNTKVTTVNTGAVVVSSSALPTGAATLAKQPALGTAGAASSDVITVQGVASMTALKVDGSAVTQPVSIATAPVLVAGSALIGKVGIDQTTPGTTNKVSIGTDGTVQVKGAVSVTGSGTTGTVSTVITLTAPANAVGFILTNLDTSTANIRWALGRTATTAVGAQLQAGRDTGFVPCGANISIVSESGTQGYDVAWVAQ